MKNAKDPLKLIMKCFSCCGLILLGIFLLSSCARVQPVIKEAEPAKKRFTILLTNSTLGTFEPEGCGCRRLGGLARRAHFIQEARTKYPAVMVLDAGNLLYKPEDFSRSELTTKAAYMLAALDFIKTDALNVGSQDCSLGLDLLKKREKKLLFPLISANLKRHSTREYIFRPYTIKTLHGSKIGILGLTGCDEHCQQLKQRDIITESPVVSATRVVQELQAQGCSIIILLSQLDSAGNKKVAREVQGIDFILGSSGQPVVTHPLIVGDTTIISPGPGGKHIGRLEIDFEKKARPFYNIKSKEAVMLKLEELRDREKNPESKTAIEETVLKRVLMEEKLKSFEGKNAYRYSPVALDNTVPHAPQVNLLVEKYRKDLLRSRQPSYTNRIPAVDISALSEEKRLMAVRLLNEITCDEVQSIAYAAGGQPFCRELALLIVDGISKGEAEGKIRYRVLYEKEKHKKILDKNLLLE